MFSQKRILLNISHVTSQAMDPNPLIQEQNWGDLGGKSFTKTSKIFFSQIFDKLPSLLGNQKSPSCYKKKQK